jgi:hypothetical protein
MTDAERSVKLIFNKIEMNQDPRIPCDWLRGSWRAGPHPLPYNPRTPGSAGGVSSKAVSAQTMASARSGLCPEAAIHPVLEQPGEAERTGQGLVIAGLFDEHEKALAKPGRDKS